MKFRQLRPSAWTVILHAAVLFTALILIVAHRGRPPVGKDKIVVLPVEGMIAFGPDSVRHGVNVDQLVATIKSLRDKDDVKAIILRINSPGGTVAAVQEISEALAKFRAKNKIVVASFGDVAASGGYYIACAGDAIVSQPGTLTGSIGVIMQLPNVQGLLNKVGVTFDTIKSGSMKDAGSPFRRMTDAERSHFESLIMAAYGQFLNTVEHGRHMDEATLKPLADGRVFLGSVAKDIHLVDELGGLEESIELAKKLAHLEDKNPEIIEQKNKNSLDKLLELFSRSPLDRLETLAPAEARLLFLMQ